MALKKNEGGRFMREVLTAAQMRAIEQAAMDSGRVTGLDLMERAGRGVVDAILAEWPDLQSTAQRAIVLCGPGGNGGDGYVVARLLSDWGWQVRVFALAPPETPDAAAMLSRWSGPVPPLSALDWADLEGAPMVIDAMFGTGLSRDIGPGVWGALAMAQRSGCRIVAVDILSGLCADSGRVRSPDFLDMPVGLTVTFHRPRVGHYLAKGAELSGGLRVVSLGLDRELEGLLRKDGDAVIEVDFPRLSLLAKVTGHKFSHGHALVLAGGVGRGGAARLAARGALRIGAGLVTVGCPASALVENAARLDAVMLRRVSEPAELAEVLADRRINAVCLGPGLGLARARALLPVVLGAVRDERTPDARPRRVVLDADALTVLAEEPDLFALLDGDCVLTPHGGEFARLFADLAARLAEVPRRGPVFSKVDATRAAAARTGAVVLFKGPDTVIAHPSGACSLSGAAYARRAPWLATAGSGDVLAGFVTGLLARGYAPLHAAETAAWLHVEAARSFGPGLIAEDLPDALPKVFRALEI